MRKCVICGSDGAILHHISYDPPKAVPVCESCHRKLHAGTLVIEEIPAPHRPNKLKKKNDLIIDVDESFLKRIRKRFAEYDRKARDWYDRYALTYMEIDPKIVTPDGYVISCGAKYFYEKIVHIRIKF